MSDDMLKDAIMKNFRPEIRKFVVQSRVTDIKEILQAARAAEIVETEHNTDTNLSQLAEELKESQRNMESRIEKFCSKMEKNVSVTG